MMKHKSYFFIPYFYILAMVLSKSNMLKVIAMFVKISKHRDFQKKDIVHICILTLHVQKNVSTDSNNTRQL
jgi:hypothetical protein